MWERIKSTTEHPVIAGLALLAFSAIVTWVSGWWPAIGQGLYAVGAWMTGVSAVSNWLLTLMGMLSLIAVASLIVQAVESLGEEPEPAWASYTADIFDGIRWRWRYTSSQDVVNIRPHCVDCNLQLAPVPVGNHAVPHWRYACEACDNKGFIVEESLSYTEDRIRRLIERNMNNLLADA